MYQFLQTIPLAPAVSPDSLAAKTEQLQEIIRSTPPQDLLAMFGEQALRFGLKVLAAIALYIIGGWIISLIKKGMKKSFLRKKTEATVATFSESLVTISLWVLLILAVVGTLGVNTTSLAALLAAGGMAIGMALSGTVQNFAGGIMLLVFRPFKVGDFIETQGYSGKVTEVTIVSTKLLTTDNRLIILPNGTLSNGNISNVTGRHLRRVDIPVSVAYGADAEVVKNALLEMVRSNKLFLDSKTHGAQDPFAGLTELADSSVNFVVRAWVKAPDYWDARFQLQETIYKELPAKYGVEFPFPQLDVHMIK
jgi:small conductance mechanosensitive channel